MKTIVIIAFCFIVFNLKAQDTIKRTGGPHGGSMRRIENYNIETLNAHKSVFAYLYDKDLVPVSNKGIKGELLLFYVDDASLNVILKAHESNGFVAEVANQDYFYFVINLNISRKIISAKFENLLRLAEKQKK